MSKKINTDYNFNVIEALKNKDYAAVVDRAPIFIWHKPSNTTYIITNIKVKSTIKNPDPRYYVVMKFKEKRYCYYGRYDDELYEFGVPSEGEEIVTVNTEVLVDNMKLDEYYPAWPMTDKQHNALLNCGYEETLLRSMSGKQAWTTINTLAKQWRAKKTDHAIFEECNDDWYDDCECVSDYW